MEYSFLLLLHVVFAALWAGGAIAVGLFVIPSVFEAGPAAGAVMGGVVKRRFPILMTVSGLLVAVSGIRMYMLRFDAAWVTTPEGIVLSLGALLGIAALFMGLLVQKPTMERMSALGAQIGASGAPATAEQSAELQVLRVRAARTAKVIAWHLLAALVLMASHRLAAGL
jgi:uncharacterized membrane protein